MTDDEFTVSFGPAFVVDADETPSPSTDTPDALGVHSGPLEPERPAPKVRYRVWAMACLGPEPYHRTGEWVPQDGGCEATALVGGLAFRASGDGGSAEVAAKVARSKVMRAVTYWLTKQ